MQFLIKSTLIGIVSGVLLGFFFKGIEISLGIKVYTLLLNIDYIPYLKELSLPEWGEFLLHLIVSILLCIILYSLIRRSTWTNKQMMVRIVLINTIIGFLLYPTTALSTRTPALTSLEALSFWIIGHIVYGVILALLFRKREN
ncbi:hypothetical protein [Bacillus pinisoli]|uniref:hypothetical protein n=1 Tax=Bacillus pinisoli TaxID=2901866 RepID=UPI001FF394ED|nr:hypothetical protein [Bacillus pinisoli]